MRIHIHLPWISFGNDDHEDAVMEKLDMLLERSQAVSVELDNVIREVSELRTVNDSVVALLEGLSQQIADLAANATELSELKAALGQVATDLDSEAGRVAAAVLAHTPAPPPGPTPTPEPTPEPGP